MSSSHDTNLGHTTSDLPLELQSSTQHGSLGLPTEPAPNHLSRNTFPIHGASTTPAVISFLSPHDRTPARLAPGPNIAAGLLDAPSTLPSSYDCSDARSAGVKALSLTHTRLEPAAQIGFLARCSDRIAAAYTGVQQFAASFQHLRPRFWGRPDSGQLGSFSPPNYLAPAAQLHSSNGSMSSPSRAPISQSPPEGGGLVDTHQNHDDSWLADPYCHDSFDYDASASHTPNSDSDHHAASPVSPPSQIPLPNTVPARPAAFDYAKKRIEIMQWTALEKQIMGQTQATEWVPPMPSNWIGSNFDSQMPKQGCVRWVSLNARVLSHSDKGIHDQNSMFTRFRALHASVIGLSDVATQDCTAKEPRSSLFKSMQIARSKWRSPGMTATHAQGSPGVMREVVGGSLFITDDVVSAILGKALLGPLHGGRWSGRRLVGSDKYSILGYNIYFPTFADESHPGSAWQTQLRVMAKLPDQDRATDPWHQALADFTMQILGDLASQSKDTVARTMIIITGDWNTKWHRHTGSAFSRRRTESLRQFASQFGLSEVFSTLFPQVTPVTYVRSDSPGCPTSWIDHTLVSSELLADGHILEAGILLHEKVNDSDHRAYMFEINLSTALHLGPEYALSPVSEPRLPKLNIKSHEQVSAFQQQVDKHWRRLKVASVQQRAETEVEQWLSLRAANVARSDTADTVTLTAIEALYDALIVTVVGAWRSASNCLPCLYKTGGARKNIWSIAYVEKAREFRTLTDIVSMWARSHPKAKILERLELSPSLTLVKRTAPGLNSDTAAWRQWIAYVRTRACLKRNELHGVWRALAREAMLGAIKSRSDAYALGAQRSAISSWLNRAKRPPPMRSILTVDSDGNSIMTSEPTLLKLTIDTAFAIRASGGHGPLNYFPNTKLDSPCSEGRAMRIALADRGIGAIDTTGIPPYLLYVLQEAQRKFIPSLGCFAGPEPYNKRGFMQSRTQSQWLEYWASRRKGTAPGQSQLSVSLIWALQQKVVQTPPKTSLSAREKKSPPGSQKAPLGQAVRQVGTPPLAPAPEKRKAPPALKNHLTSKAKHVKEPTSCKTAHVFDALRVLCNLVLVTALVPTGMLRNILCLVDKVAGSHSLSNKRPLGMVEQLAQATLGPQFRIMEDVWHEHEMLDKFQSGGSRETGCDVPIMLVTAKLEHAWIYKHNMALVLQDQSKAFETLRQFLGQEIPMRRLGVPEPGLDLFNAFKTGSWFMVATAWGPREQDWSLIVGTVSGGVNTQSALPARTSDPAQRQIGFHDEHGTTQGGAGGPTIFRGQTDWLATLQRIWAIDSAPYTGPKGKKIKSAGHGFIDDVINTSTSQEGACRAITISSDFYALQDGALNLDKSLAALAEFRPDGKHKMFAGPGEDFDEKYHIPRVLTVPNNAAIYLIGLATAELESGLCSDERRCMLNLEIQQLELKTTVQIEVIEPDTPFNYLGNSMTAGLYSDKAVLDAKSVADLAAAAIMTTSIKPREAQQIARSVPTSQAVYKLKCTTKSGDDLAVVDQKLRSAVRTKSGYCRTFANRACDGTFYESIANSVLAERIMMVLRLLHIRDPVAAAMQGSLWRLQRFLGTATPALEYKHAGLIGWDGSWVSALAIWLSTTSLTITGGRGLQPLCSYDVCLVDLAPEANKKDVAWGCWTHEVWRLSEITDASGLLRPELLECGEWSGDTEWCSLVVEIYSAWLTADTSGLGTAWKLNSAWNIDELEEHQLVASEDNGGDPLLGVIVQIHSPTNSPPSRATVRWLRRMDRPTGYNAVSDKAKLWLDGFGGRGASQQPLRRSSRNVPANRQTGGAQGARWNQWLWWDASEDYVIVEVSSLVPVRTSSTDTIVDDENITITVISESMGWCSNSTNWQRTAATWTMDTQRLTGTLYEGTTMAPEDTRRRAANWEHTMAEHDESSVLYAYSDCSKTDRGPRKVLSYGWITGGLASRTLVDTYADGTWTVHNSEDDMFDLRPGLWGGGVVQGCQRELTTYRGEGTAVLACAKGLRLAGYAGKLIIFEDNKAVADKFNGRQPRVNDECIDPGSSVPCLDDLADADLWHAVDEEVSLWEGNLQCRWTRGHPERRCAKTMWHRHDHGNTWSDHQADDSLRALEHTLDECSTRLQLADPDSSGGWGVAWEGVQVITSVNKAIRAALATDSFYEYLEVNRGWPAATLAMFSKERWASKLTMLRTAANATVITKMITGWLASQSGMLKRGQVVLATLDEAQILGVGLCRCCGTAPETNWHVQAECTHPRVVAERRAASLCILKAIDKLALPKTASQLVSLHWMLDAEGKAHDLSDIQDFQGQLREWAPDIADRAEAIQEHLLWAAAQGTNKDNLRKWAFRGLMLDHWLEILADLGVSALSATAALNTIERTIMQSFPAIWTTFSEITHEGRPAACAGRDMDARIEDVFRDWAKDQGPMPITRGEVAKLTLRAKRRWVVARNRDLKKLRRDHSKVLSAQQLITGFLAAPAPANPSLLASLRASSYLQEATRAVKQKRKIWTQRLLRDHGFEPGDIRMQQAQEASPRERGPREQQHTPRPQQTDRLLPNPPGVVRVHPFMALREPMLTPAQRRHRDHSGRLRDHQDRTLPEAVQRPEKTNSEYHQVRGCHWDTPGLPEPYPTPATPPSETQYVLFDRGER